MTGAGFVNRSRSFEKRHRVHCLEISSVEYPISRWLGWPCPRIQGSILANNPKLIEISWSAIGSLHLPGKQTQTPVASCMTSFCGFEYANSRLTTTGLLATKVHPRLSHMPPLLTGWATWTLRTSTDKSRRSLLFPNSCILNRRLATSKDRGICDLRNSALLPLLPSPRARPH